MKGIRTGSDCFGPRRQCFWRSPALAAELRFTIWTGNEAHLKMLNGYAESFRARRTRM
jgi:multiple sugar transport system substrate-binding protein